LKLYFVSEQLLNPRKNHILATHKSSSKFSESDSQASVRPNSELCGENKQKPRQKAKAIFQEK
jgi:hypothetical protein